MQTITVRCADGTRALDMHAPDMGAALHRLHLDGFTVLDTVTRAGVIIVPAHDLPEPW